MPAGNLSYRHKHRRLPATQVASRRCSYPQTSKVVAPQKRVAAQSPTWLQTRQNNFVPSEKYITANRSPGLYRGAAYYRLAVAPNQQKQQ